MLGHLQSDSLVMLHYGDRSADPFTFWPAASHVHSIQHSAVRAPQSMLHSSAALSVRTPACRLSRLAARPFMAGEQYYTANLWAQHTQCCNVLECLLCTRRGLNSPLSC